MIVAQLYPGDKNQWHSLYNDGSYIASVWGKPTLHQPDGFGDLLVKFTHGREIIAFWHVHRTYFEPATPAELEAMGIVT